LLHAGLEEQQRKLVQRRFTYGKRVEHAFKSV